LKFQAEHSAAEIAQPVFILKQEIQTATGGDTVIGIQIIFFRQKDKVVLVTKEDNENCKSDRVSPVGFSQNKIAK